MFSLDPNNRILASAERNKQRIQGFIDKGVDLRGEPIMESLERLDEGMALSFSDHVGYQEAQARAHDSGRITTDEAQTVYLALGEGMSSENGGWQEHVTLPLKLAITQVVGELMGVEI